MSSKFIVSNRVHDPPRDFTSVPACTFINSSGQEFIDMETHQMDIDARDAAYRQEVHNRLVRQQSDPAQKAELKAFLAEFNHFDNFGFDVDIYKRPWIIKKRAPNDSRPIRRSFTSCYDFKAIGWRVVDANLASVLKVEGRKSPEREIFTDEQVTLILNQKNTPTGQMVIALLACGVRIYELLHFKHEDFHRTESGAYLIGGCKTEAGRNRIIPILDFGIPIFEHAYATSVENGPLFPNGKGGFWNEKNWRNRKFYPFLEEIGIQPNPYDENGKRKPEFAGKLATYTPYTTRHTYASLCDRAGVNKDILKRAVGHTPKSKTLDEVYLHPKATQMIEAFDKANQLVNDEVLTTTKA